MKQPYVRANLLILALVLVSPTSHAQIDTSPPAFIQNTITFVRVSDNFQVGTEIIPPAGLTKSSVARDRRFVVAVSAGDNESGIASIRLQGGTAWSCTARIESKASSQQGTLSVPSDEVKNNTSTAGNPLLRSARFTIDLFDGKPARRDCVCTDDAGPHAVTFRLVARNGKGLETTSAPITVRYLPQLPTCGVASGAICGNKALGRVLTCGDGRSCDFKQSTVCSGFFIFRTCNTVQTTDMFCP